MLLVSEKAAWPQHSFYSGFEVNAGGYSDSGTPRFASCPRSPGRLARGRTKLNTAREGHGFGRVARTQRRSGFSSWGNWPTPFWNRQAGKRCQSTDVCARCRAVAFDGW